MQAADLIKGKFVLVVCRLLRPRPRLFAGTEEEAKLFELLAVLEAAEHPQPRAAKLNAAVKIDDGVNDFAEVVGNVCGGFAGVCLSVCRFVDVPHAGEMFVIFRVDLLHDFLAPALAVGVVFESKRFILPFEFFDGLNVVKVNVFHL